MTVPFCINPALPEEADPESRDFDIVHLSKSQLDAFSANIVSSLQAGCFFGSLFASPLSDRFGRRITLALAAITFCIGSAMQTASSGNKNVMYTARAIGGLVSCLYVLLPC